MLGGPLETCGTDPMTGFFRDGCCAWVPEDLGQHTICAVMTTDFLRYQSNSGNDLTTPIPAYNFPGLQPGDRWCVVARRWYHAYLAGYPAPVVLASTDRQALEIVPLDVLKEHAVDVPDDLSSLG